MSARSDLVDIAGELRRETEKAFLIFDGTREPEDGTFAMPEWLALDKGLI